MADNFDKRILIFAPIILRVSLGMRELDEDQRGRLISDLLVPCAETAQDPLPPVVYHRMYISPGGAGGANSINMRNLLIDMHKLWKLVATGTITIAGSINMPWLAFLGALVVIGDIRDAMKVEIPERASVILWTLWKHANSERLYRKDRLLQAVNSEMGLFDRAQISNSEYEDACSLLIDLHCIELVEGDHVCVRLCEKVEIKEDRRRKRGLF